MTIRDVARASGVHISTVSRTFSAPHLVNPETRTRVLATAEQLGYRPNRAARALITGRTHNIGLIVADIANPFFPPLIKAAETQARQRDYHVFVADTNEDPVVEEELVHALAKQVDGDAAVQPADEQRPDRAAPPRGAAGRHQPPGRPACPRWSWTSRQGARTAFEHLRRPRPPPPRPAGRAAWLLDQPGDPPGRGADRPGGRRRAHRARPAPADRGGGPRPPRPCCATGATAVLAYNDLMAIGLLEALHDRGVRVPGRASASSASTTSCSAG